MNRQTRIFAAFGLFAALVAQGCTCNEPVVNKVEPNGQVSPATLDFGKVEVGASQALQVQIEHTRGSSLVIKDVQIAGDLGDWFAASTRQLTVNSGTTGAIDITFTPLAEKPATGTMTLTTNSLDVPTFTVELSGEGFLPKVQVDPASIDFGNVLVDTTESAKVEITNSGTEASAVRILPLTGQSAEHYRIDLPAGTNDGTFLLGGGEAAEIDVTFSPTVSGRKLAAFTVEPCEVCQPVNVTLSGNALDSGLIVEPTSIDFGAVNPGASVSRDVTFKNVGNRQIQITRAEIKNIAAGQLADPAFGLDSDQLPILLEPASEATLPVSFGPTDVKNHTAQLVWYSTDGNNAEGKIVLIGHGGGPDIDVIPPQVDFGPVALGVPLTRQVIVANVGFDDLHVTGVEVQDSTAFSVLDVPADMLIPVGGTETITVQYAPTAEQADEGRVIISSNDADEPETAVLLTGNGLDLPPCTAEVAPSEVNFGMTERNKKRSLQIGITNPEGSAGSCLVTSLDLTADTDPEFTLPDGPVNGLILDPGERHLVTVDFQPTRLGTYSGAVHFYISDPSAPEQEVPLTGRAASAEVMIAPDDLDFGVVMVGCATRDREFCIYNTSSSPVTLQSLSLVEAGDGGEFGFRDYPPGFGSANGVTIPGGGKVCFTVRYRARDLGTDTAAIYVGIEEYPDPFLITISGTGATDAVQTDTFVQLDQPQADILFVVDNSGSMCDDQDNLAANFGSFIQFAVNQAIDYHIAVTSTDVTTAGGNVPGLFAPQDGSRERIVNPNLPDPEGTFRANVRLGCDGDYTEKGFEGAYRALCESCTSPLINDPNANGGFLRNGAALAMVFVSDEPEQSDNTVDFYLNFFWNIRGFRNQNLFSASAIVDSSSPRYHEIQARTGGVVESITTNDWSVALQNLSLVAFGYKTTFFLKNLPAGTPVVVIKKPSGSSFEAQPGTWTYDAESNAVIFDAMAIPEPGDTIEITYEVQCIG